MEIKIQGNKDWLHTDPHKVPAVLLKKYPEGHFRYIGLTTGQIRRRLDEGYQFVPLNECGGLGEKLTPLAEKIGIPKDVYMVGDTVLMVNHKVDNEAKRKYVDNTIKSMTKNIKETAKESVKEAGGFIEQEVIKKEGEGIDPSELK